MSFCIFIASSTATTSPSFTLSPTLTGTLTIRPCMGAITVPSPVLGGDAVAVPASDAPPADGVTVMPAPVTRTLKTSPSTSTSNSAVDTGAGGGGSGAGAGGGSAMTVTAAGGGVE